MAGSEITGPERKGNSHSPTICKMIVEIGHHHAFAAQAPWATTPLVAQM
jgi:hypothetical protein